MSFDGYTITRESAEGRTLLRARSSHAATGMQVTLTFPLEPAEPDRLRRLQQRLGRLAARGSGPCG